MQNYQVGKLLGTGSFGQVFLCRHKVSMEYYAMKKLRMLQLEENQKFNIENQLKLLQRLRHINIVSLKDSFTNNNGQLCIVLIFCQGGDMYNKIRSIQDKGKTFPQSQILDWLIQIALAIHYLHNQKIIHRDIKTQNLFLMKDEQIRLGDFGISKVLDSTQDIACSFVIGTPYYMAPQVFNNKPYSYKSDIWSLGCILYELCNLRRPFEAQSKGALAIKVIRGSFPTITPTYTKQLRDLITIMLNRKPQKRPSIIQILNKPFLRSRLQRYIIDNLKRKVQVVNLNDVNLDSLRVQAQQLDVQLQQPKNLNSQMYLTNSELFKPYETIKKKEKNALKNSFHKNQQKNTSSNSTKILNNVFDEKQAFVDHKRSKMMDDKFFIIGKQQQKHENSSSFLQNQSLYKFQQYQPQRSKFKIQQQYSMEDQDKYFNLSKYMEQQIIEESSQQQVQQHIEDEQQVPQEYNRYYYKYLDQIKLLKYKCQHALGSQKYMKAYHAVQNGTTKAIMLQILGKQSFGYWHFLDQILYYEQLLKGIPKNRT